MYDDIIKLNPKLAKYKEEIFAILDKIAFSQTWIQSEHKQKSIYMYPPCDDNKHRLLFEIGTIPYNDKTYYDLWSADQFICILSVFLEQILIKKEMRIEMPHASLEPSNYKEKKKIIDLMLEDKYCILQRYNVNIKKKNDQLFFYNHLLKEYRPVTNALLSDYIFNYQNNEDYEMRRLFYTQ